MKKLLFLMLSALMTIETPLQAVQSSATTKKNKTKKGKKKSGKNKSRNKPSQAPKTITPITMQTNQTGETANKNSQIDIYKKIDNFITSKEKETISNDEILNLVAELVKYTTENLKNNNKTTKEINSATKHEPILKIIHNIDKLEEIQLVSLESDFDTLNEKDEDKKKFNTYIKNIVNFYNTNIKNIVNFYNTKKKEAESKIKEIKTENKKTKEEEEKENLKLTEEFSGELFSKSETTKTHTRELNKIFLNIKNGKDLKEYLLKTIKYYLDIKTNTKKNYTNTAKILTIIEQINEDLKLNSQATITIKQINKLKDYLSLKINDAINSYITAILQKIMINLEKIQQDTILSNLHLKKAIETINQIDDHTTYQVHTKKKESKPTKEEKQKKKEEKQKNQEEQEKKNKLKKEESVKAYTKRKEADSLLSSDDLKKAIEERKNKSQDEKKQKAAKKSEEELKKLEELENTDLL